ncbi:hypothetical protein, partial [Bacillus thuringiensis]|uniref:hypothetical protein n=1 Tax=Bacillus thuringiensis TaxID=1428 RepID=UPI0011A3DA6C
MWFVRKCLVEWIGICIGEWAKMLERWMERSGGNGYMEDIRGIDIMVEMFGQKGGGKEILKCYICD